MVPAGAGRRGDARAVGQAVRRGAIEAPTGRSLGFLIWTRRMKPSRARATPSRGVHPAFSGSVTGQIDSRKDQSSDPDFPLGGRPLRRAAAAARSRRRRRARRANASWLFEALASPKSTVPRRPAVEEIGLATSAHPPSSARRNPYEARRALAGAWSSGNAADALANATRYATARRPRSRDPHAIGRYHPYGVDPSFSAYKTPRARALSVGHRRRIRSPPVQLPAARDRSARRAHRTPEPRRPRPRVGELVGAARTVSARCTAPGHRRARDLNRRARGDARASSPTPRITCSTPTAASGSRTASPDLSTSPRDTRSSTSRSRSPHERAARWRDAPTKTPPPCSDPRSPPRPDGAPTTPTTDPRKTRLPRIPDPRSTRTDPNPRTTRQI